MYVHVIDSSYLKTGVVVKKGNTLFFCQTDKKVALSMPMRLQTVKCSCRHDMVGFAFELSVVYQTALSIKHWYQNGHDKIYI
jgi:hypothetical protein